MGVDESTLPFLMTGILSTRGHNWRGPTSSIREVLELLELLYGSHTRHIAKGIEGLQLFLSVRQGLGNCLEVEVIVPTSLGIDWLASRLFALLVLYLTSASWNCFVFCVILGGILGFEEIAATDVIFMS